jgi:hypothetical protein
MADLPGLNALNQAPRFAVLGKDVNALGLSLALALSWQYVFIAGDRNITAIVVKEDSTARRKVTSAGRGARYV